MAEQDRNSMSTENYKQAEKLDDEFIGGDSKPLCPKCLTPCHPLQYYCHNCDSNEAINPLSSYMPFVRIRFNVGMVAKAWREMLYDKEASTIFRLICLFVIILFILTLCC